MKTPARAISSLLAFCLSLASAAWADSRTPHATPPAQTLAEELFDEGQYAAAAIEFRRLALRADDPAETAAWLWMAANACAQPGDVQSSRLALDLLDDAEDAAPPDDPACSLPIAFLRAKLSLRLKDTAAARYYYQSIPGKIPPSAAPGEAAAWRECAARGAAAAALAAGDLPAARAEAAPFPDVLAAVDAHAAASRKSPTLGGILGLVPGLGYAYSGEWANAVRSILLNSLFIWAMRETAADDEWALFSVAAFFEFTWYSGSVYGGIDAAHRHNRRIDQTALDALLAPNTPSSPRPSSDPLRLPLLSFPL